MSTRPSDVIKGFEGDPRFVDQSFDEHYVLIVYTHRPTRMAIVKDGVPTGEYAVGFDVIGPMPVGDLNKAKLSAINFLDRELPNVTHSVHSFKGRPVSSLHINPDLPGWEASARKRIMEPR